MNSREKLMLDVMAELMRLQAPVVFKGAMLLKIATENTTSSVVRETKDLDGDWLQSDVSMEQMKDFVDDAIRAVDPSLSTIAFREFSENKSAGFWIVNPQSERMFSIDLGIRPHSFYQDYQIMYQGQPVDIRGATLTKMLSDKIRAISSPKVFRRAKDLVDVYILSHCKKIALMDVYRMVYTDGHAPGTFDEFCHRRDDLKHAYEKLLNVENKPDFITMYKRLTAFLTPFINKRPQTLEWTGDKWASPQRTQENVRGLGR